jgi:hypothetical protein
MFATDPQDSLVPLFGESKYNGSLQPVGTGIFVEFMRQPFLFTAAHVTDELKKGPLMVPGFDGIHDIEGYLGYVDLLPDQSRNQDQIDVAYYRLTTLCSRSLCTHFRPLPHSRVRLAPTSLDLGVCSIYGYPASRSKRKGSTYSSEPCAYRGVSGTSEDYTAEGLSPDLSVIINFHKKRAVSRQNGSRINPISPRGVSGGGIFAWPKGQELSEDWSIPELVGIFHTYKEAKGLMVGTSMIAMAAAVQLGRMKNFGGIQ